MNNTSIKTRSGIEIDMLNPKIEDINIKDIAYALSRIERFNGYLMQPQSVAQHSIRVSKMVPDEYKLDALMHDATEAYTGDIHKPLKNALGETFKRIEESIEELICTKFNLSFPIPDIVMKADKQDYFDTVDVQLKPFGIFFHEKPKESPNAVMKQFLDLFDLYTKELERV